MELGKSLLRLCRERGWTLARLSKESGVPQPSLHRWTTTSGSTVNLAQLKKVCDALQISMHTLTWGTPDPHEIPTDEILKELFSGDIRLTVHRIERRKPTRRDAK
jgi:DNA-binding Xre family transcriptional regulator